MKKCLVAVFLIMSFLFVNVAQASELSNILGVIIGEATPFDNNKTINEMILNIPDTIPLIHWEPKQIDETTYLVIAGIQSKNSELQIDGGGVVITLHFILDVEKGVWELIDTGILNAYETKIVYWDCIKTFGENITNKLLIDFFDDGVVFMHNITELHKMVVKQNLLHEQPMEDGSTI